MADSASTSGRSTPGLPEHLLDEARTTWRQAVAAYQSPDLRRSLWQLVNSVIPYIAMWYLSYRLLEISFWAALPAHWWGCCSPRWIIMWAFKPD